MSNNFSLILTKKRIKMITRNEKAKGLWWRLLATLPVLAILMIANTKVSAQDASKKLNNRAVDKPIKVEMGQFEIFDDDGAPMQLKDTVIYSDDGSYVKFETSDGFQPETGEPCKKLTVTSYNAEGTPCNNFYITETERRGDTSTYSIEPFSISGSLFETLLDVATSKEDTVYQIVEQMPQYTGGEKAMRKYVAENIEYPQEAKDKNISGRVFVGFVIEKDGSVSNVKVVRGIGGGCDEEAARVIKGMPKWKPGKQDGKPVRVNYMMPVFFKLDDSQPTKSEKKEKASNPDMTPDKNGVYQICEQMPEFPGGVNALIDHVGRNVVYPEQAKEKEIEGRVFVGFVVEKDGSISDVKVLRGIGGGCDEEAVRIISAMPKWKPGMQDGKPVRVSYQIPIHFKLGNGTRSKNSLVGSIWEGTGTGTKDGVTYTWHSVLQFNSENEGLLIEKLVSQKKNADPVVEFENVAMDFEYAFDGKKTGAITPKNGDGTYMDELPPEGFILSEDGKTIVLNFYTATDDTGIKFVTYTRR
jgi:TonB family protein